MTSPGLSTASRGGTAIGEADLWGQVLSSQVSSLRGVSAGLQS